MSSFHRDERTAADAVFGPRGALRGPLSFSQQRLWLLDRRLAGRPVYNVPVTLRFAGPLDVGRLVDAVRAVAARHEVLFTVFEEGPNGARQRVLDDRELPCPITDLTELEPTQAATSAERLIEQDARRPFDLARDRMLRARVFRLAEELHWLQLTFHHIACDSWSLEIFRRQLAETYRAGVTGLDPLAVQYADYALWQRDIMQGAAVDRALEAWTQALHGAPAVLDLGADRPRPAELSYRGRTQGFLLPSIPLADLEKFAADEGVTPYIVLLAAFQALVARHANSDDIVLGSPTAGRGPAVPDEMVGLFTDLLVIRTSLASDPTFRMLASRARDDVLDAMARSEAPFDLAVNHLHPERDLSHSPVVQAVFALYEEGGANVLADGVSVESYSIPTGTSKYDLTWSVYRGADGLRLEVEYATDLFDAATVEVLVNHWQTLLCQVLVDPDRPLSEIGLAAAAEAEQVRRWSGAEKQLPTGTVHELVARSAAARPDAVALVGAGVTVAYGELEERSSALARRLRALGVGLESCVGVCMPRTPDMVVACLAILKAGGVYVPLDPAFPADRMSFMLSEVDAKVVLVQEPAAAPSGPWRVVDVAEAEAGGEQQLETDTGALPEVNPANGCYVIFTSGSTGRPKGTTVTHHNVVRLIHGVRERLPFGPDDVWTLFHSVAFDFSVWEMWGALTTGGRLVVVPYSVSRNVDEFHELVHTERVTILSQTPSAFRQFETADDRADRELSLRAVVFGGEALHRPSVRRWAARHGYARPLLVNMYGITETTVHVTYHVLTEQDLDRELTQIGRPLPDLSVHVLDAHGRPCPIGVTGEIHVAGAGLSRGYTNRPELTADRFVPDHVTGRRGGVLYRSGDLGRWSAHGGLEYVGRADSQVKIRGYRIETREVEAVLGGHPQLLESAVIACRGSDGQADLASYLVPDGVAPSTDELRAWLRKRLPDYMVPRHFVILDALPLTPQGKVDRKALPEPEAVRPELAQEYGAPVGAIEQLLADIWCQVLEVDRVGRNDNFFDLGGDSIRSLQVLGMARDAGFTLRLQDIIDAPTIEELAATVAPSVPAEPSAAAGASRPFCLVPEDERALLPDGLVDAYPMAELQVGMIYEMERDRARNAYHNVETLRVAGRFDEACFREAVDRIVARHPVLRTSFDLTGFSEPMQLVHDTVDVPLVVADLRGASADDRRATLQHYLRTQQRTRFDLSTAPLFRMAVHVESEDAFLWTVTEHHSILDGWSMASTLSEIADLYRRLLAGERPATEPLRSLYRDFVAAERAALRSRESREFWRERLASPPASGILRWTAADPELAAILAGETVDGERHEHDEAAGHGVLTTPLPADLLRELEHFASQAGVPVKTALLTAQLKVISLLTGSADVLIGMTANGRLEEADAAEVRGLFLNTVPLRMRLPEGSWQALARAVFDAERDLLPHRRYPMAALQREFGGEEPLFEINFTYNNFHPIARLAAGGRLNQVGADAALRGVARTNFALDMTFSHDPAAGGLSLEIAYGLRDLAADQVTRLRDSLLRALTAMARDGQAHHRAVSLMSAGEERLLAMWQGADDVVVPDAPVHELFRERVASWPDAVAVECGADRLTFAELDVRSDALARRLVAAGACRGDAIGLHLRPGVDAVVAVWAVWKAGGAFLPLDPDLPAARLEKMLDDAVPAVLVSRDASGLPGSWTAVSPDASAHADAPDVALPRVGREDLAYVMYTSGSTGRPKGIMVEHGSLTNYAAGLMLPRLRQAGVGASARVLTGTSAFLSDFFLAQLLPLLDGHCLTVLTGADRRDPRLLVELARDPNRAVHIIDATASQIQLMVEAGLLDAPHPPRLITSSGEACPPDVWNALRSHPRVAAHNAYGPAEVTVDATYADIGAHESPVIGRPYGNVRVYLVDDGLQLVPPGTIGELVIGGPGVGRGYLGQPVATAAAFVPDPWGEAGSRLYRSGDLGRYTSDGQIEFLGRNDHQVKILGQRVEPEDVEAALRSHPAVVAAAVSAHQLGADKRLQLVAHLVLAEGAVLSRDEIRGYLAGLLPSAAIPTAVVAVEALPILEGGKLNRAALTVPDDVAAQVAHRKLAPPRTETERRIAAAWQVVLGVAQVGVHDDFFSLGGHSLLAIRLAMRVSAELGADLPLHEVLSRRTVAAQAELIDQRGGSFGRIPRLAGERGGDLPASHAQERQWFLWRLAPQSSSYHVSWGYVADGELDIAVLDASVRALLERHEPLRTTLHLDPDGRIVQRVNAASGAGLSVHEVSEAELPELVERWVRRPFDLGAGPVLRVEVLRTAPQRYVMLFVAHHVAIDEWSLEIFERELWALYRAGGDTVATGLPPLDIRYADYALWHRDLVARRAEEDLGYWRRALEDMASVSSWPHPLDSPEPPAVAAGACSGFVPAALLGRLDQVRAEAGTTDFMVLLAVYCLLLARSSGDRDFTVGVPVSGQSHPDLAPLVGFFVNTLPLRVTIHPEDDFLAHLERVRSVVLEAFAHQEAPFEHVVRAVLPNRGNGVNPLFRTMFAFTSRQEADRLTRWAPAGLTLRDLPIETGEPQFDLSLGVTRTAAGLHLKLDYSNGYFSAETAEGVLASFTDLLHAVNRTPQVAVAELLLTGPQEQGRIAGQPEGGSPRLAAPDRSPHHKQPAGQGLTLPRTEAEERVAAAWQVVLGVARVGVHEDFFALGGHSLLAIRLAMQLSREFGTEIPLAQLYTAPTIAEQASRIEAWLLVRAQAVGHSVVPLGGAPGARPLVLVHPVGGTLFSYLELVDAARADFEAFGVQGSIGEADTGATDLSALARRYADELVPVLGGGEPVVAGWSAGGVLAHELARTLAGRGIGIHRLVLIDSDPRSENAGQHQRDIAILDALRPQVTDHGPGPLLRLRQAGRLLATLGVDPAAIAELDGPTVAALMTFWRDMFVGLAAHRPAAFAGPADLVLGSSGDSADDRGVVAAWRELTGTLHVTHVDGDHFQLLRRPWVHAVADALRGSTAQTGD